MGSFVSGGFVRCPRGFFFAVDRAGIRPGGLYRRETPHRKSQNLPGLLQGPSQPAAAPNRSSHAAGGTPASATLQRPALKLVNTRVCTRLTACGKLSGAAMSFLSASLRKMVVFSATSFFTNLSEAALGLA